MGVVHGLAALIVAGMISVRCKRSIAWTLPLTVCLAMPMLLGLAMVKQLALIDALAWLVLFAAAAWLGYCAVRNHAAWHGMVKGVRAYVWTPALLCFVLLAVFWSYASQNRVPLDVDEYSYWATAVRSLTLSGGLIDGAHTCTYLHGSYPPGMQLLEWWGMHALGTWREGMLYTVCFLTNTVFMLPLMARITWRRGWVVPVFVISAIALPTVFTGFAYTMLTTDSTLGVLFGALLFTVWQARDNQTRFDDWMVAALLVALVLTKRSGVLWAAGGLVLMGLLWSEGSLGVRIRRWLLIGLPATLVWLGWQSYCAMAGLSEVHDTNIVQAIQGVVWGGAGLADGTLAVWRGALKIMLLTPTNQSPGWDGMHPWLGLPLSVWVAFFVAVAWWVSRGLGTARKAYRRYAVFFAAFTALYFVQFLLSVPTVFAPEVMRWATRRDVLLDVIDRYFIPVQIGGAYVCVAMLMQSLRQANAENEPDHVTVKRAKRKSRLIHATGAWQESKLHYAEDRVGYLPPDPLCEASPTKGCTPIGTQANVEFRAESEQLTSQPTQVSRRIAPMRKAPRTAQGWMAGFLVFLLLCINWQTLACLLPSGYAARFATDNGSAWMREHFTWYNTITEPAACRVLTPGGFPLSVGYALVPMSFVTAPIDIAAEDAQTAIYALVAQTHATHVLVLSNTQQDGATLELAFHTILQPDVLYRIDTTTTPYTLVAEPQGK